MRLPGLPASVLLLVVVPLAACGDDSQPGDAPTATVDAAPDAPPDGPPANACTGAPYDPCTANPQCMSNNCRTFMGAGLQVCTQACDADNPCPPQDGAAVLCNNMGICRPTAANDCER